jgi:hypothetical protein
MPETRSGAGGAGPSNPAREQATDEHEVATVGDIMTHMQTLISGIEALRSEVREVKSREDSMRQELSRIAAASEGHGNTAVSGRKDDDMRNGDGEKKAQEHGTVHRNAGLQDRGSFRVEYISVGEAHKLYSRELEADRVSRIGDYRFPAARMTWRRVLEDSPVRPELLRRLVGVAFSGAAKKVYEEVSASNLSATADELWDAMELKVYNVSQQRSQRASFYAASWKEKTESIEHYGARLAKAAMTRPEHVSDEALVHRFVEGLPQRLKVQALLISGDYDEVVAKTSLVQKASQRAAIGPEMIRGVNEGRELRPMIPFSEQTCFRCNQKGHIARFCPQAGNGEGSSEQSKQNTEHGSQNGTTQKNQSGAQPAQGTKLQKH